jgi:hypothetical protein
MLSGRGIPWSKTRMADAGQASIYPFTAHAASRARQPGGAAENGL